MKRTITLILSALLAVTMLLTLAGCGNKQETPAATTAAEPAASATEAAAQIPATPPPMTQTSHSAAALPRPIPSPGAKTTTNAPQTDSAHFAIAMNFIVLPIITKWQCFGEWHFRVIVRSAVLW